MKRDDTESQEHLHVTLCKTYITKLAHALYRAFFSDVEIENVIKIIFQHLCSTY